MAVRLGALGQLGLLAAVLAAGCTSAATSGPATTARPAGSASPAGSGAIRPAAAGDWPAYHLNAQRTGVAADLPAAGALSLAWSRRLGGAVYGQPLVLGRTVIAATESDEVYGLSLATGAVRWHRTVGTPEPGSHLPCGNVTPLGITSTPVYDPATGLVYVVAQNGAAGHVLVGLRPADGRVELRRSVPSPDGEPAYDQQRGALALTDQHIYVVFGGHFGDCGPYIGSVVGMPADGRGPVWSYRVPTRKQGGIWASGGPVVSPSGTIFVSSGNGASFKPPFDGSDSVIALTPRLHRTGVFAPTDWAYLAANDLDLGSMSPALMSDGRILQVGKSGVGYLLNAAHLGGVGGQLAQGKVCDAFGGAAVSGTVVYVPCQGLGLTAVDTAGTRVKVAWRAASGTSGSPVVGGGAVWATNPFLGILYELAPRTGQVRHQIALHVGVSLGEQLPDFDSPSLAGRLVLVGTMTGVTAVSGA
jgi:outer membrane protein assembly factor BamB